MATYHVHGYRQTELGLSAAAWLRNVKVSFIGLKLLFQRLLELMMSRLVKCQLITASPPSLAWEAL